MAIDLSTEYLGLELSSPLLASSSPCTGQIDVLQELADHGAGAAVLPSLFQEQLDRPGSAGSPLPKFPHLNHYNAGADAYLKLIERARAAVDIPVIASLNGSTLGGWVENARRLEQAGASALELNLHFVPIDPSVSGQQMEARCLDVTAAIRHWVKIPLAAKIGPYFSSIPYFARQLTESGVGGLVLFNRFLEPDIDLETMSMRSRLELSQPRELRNTLRWIGILRDQLPDASLAATGGIHSGVDVVKAIAVGANAVMATSVLLERGARYIETLREQTIQWMEQAHYGGVRALTGVMSRRRVGADGSFERANYAATLASYLDHGATGRATS